MSVSLLNTVLRAGKGLPLNLGERLVLLVAAWRADESGRTFMAGLAIVQQAGLSTQAGYPALKRLLGFGLLRSTRPVTIDVSRLSQMALAATLEGDAAGEAGEETSKELANNSKELANNSKELVSKEVVNNSKEVASKEVASKELASKELANSVTSKLPSTSKELATINYKTNKTHTNACAREGSSVSGEGAPTGDGEASGRVRVVKAQPAPSTAPMTIRVEAAEVQDKASLGLFLKEYPKRAMNRLVVCAEWAALEAEGFAGKRLLAAMREARMSKQWCEDGGRYVPRAEIFLHDRRFEDFLPAAAERASVKTHEQMLADEEAEARKRAAIDDIIAEEFFGGAPIESMEDVMARNAKRPEAERIYEERKRAGTLKPVRLAIDEVREREAREKEASHV